MDVQVITGVKREAVLVPESAVLFGKQGPYLFAIGKEGKAELRPVKTGIRNENQIQIVQGVAAGESVVALGQFLLYPGATVVDPSRLPPPAAGQKK